MHFAKIFGAALALAALPVAGFAQSFETPRGTYLVYAEADGTAFVAVDPTLAESQGWPLMLYYFQQGTTAGAAQATAIVDCAAGRATARITEVFDAANAPVAVPAAMAPIAFDRASESAGDIAIVDFLCGDANARLAQTSAPIFGTPAGVSRNYVALRALGLGDRLARDIAIRDPATNDALIGTAVPENLRDRVRAIAGAAR